MYSHIHLWTIYFNEYMKLSQLMDRLWINESYMRGLWRKHKENEASFDILGDPLFKNVFLHNDFHLFLSQN